MKNYFLRLLFIVFGVIFSPSLFAAEYVDAAISYRIDTNPPGGIYSNSSSACDAFLNYYVSNYLSNGWAKITGEVSSCVSPDSSSGGSVKLNIYNGGSLYITPSSGISFVYICPAGTTTAAVGGRCLCDSTGCPNKCNSGQQKVFDVFSGWLKPDGNHGYTEKIESSDATIRFCDSGCLYDYDLDNPDPDNDPNMYWDGSNVGEWTPYFFKFGFKSIGESCSSTDDPSKPTTPQPSDNPPDKCPSGKVPGTLNGNLVCLDPDPTNPVGGGNNTGGGDKPAGGDSSTDGSGSGGDGSSGGGDKPGTGDKPGGDGTGGGTASGGGDGTGGGGSGGGGDAGAGAGDKSDDSLLCKLFPNVLACMELGDASDAPKESPEVPSQTANVDLVPDNTFSSGGTCPTDPVINLSFRSFTVPIYSKGCDLIIRYVSHPGRLDADLPSAEARGFLLNSSGF